MKIYHLFKKINGKIHFDDKDYFDKDFARFKEGQEGLLSIEKLFRQRSIQQNRYYWGCIVDILAEEFGYTKEECHEALKWQFLRKHEEGKPDTVKSTTELSTIEFNEYNDQIKVWASTEYGIVIPDPNQVDFTES